jgi:hypothetical protein
MPPSCGARPPHDCLAKRHVSASSAIFRIASRHFRRPVLMRLCRAPGWSAAAAERRRALVHALPGLGAPLQAGAGPALCGDSMDCLHVTAGHSAHVGPSHTAVAVHQRHRACPPGTRRELPILLVHPIRRPAWSTVGLAVCAPARAAGDGSCQSGQCPRDCSQRPWRCSQCARPCRQFAGPLGQRIQHRVGSGKSRRQRASGRGERPRRCRE